MANIRALMILAVGILLGFGGLFQAKAFTGQEYSSEAKINLEQAREIAELQVPEGQIVKEELEKEAGGSGLRYSFDMRLDGVIHEVGVDAKTGQVLENSLEGKEGKEGEGREKD